MLLERNQALVGLVFVLVIAAGTVFAIGATGGMFVPGEPMEAVFEDAAGLSPRDFVYVGGFRAGEVTSVDLEGDVVRVGFSLTAPELPADSTANIILANTLGKRGLQIVPGTSREVLEAGDVIPVERTRTPVDVPELGDRTTELLGGVDVESLQDLTTALADITDDAHEDLRGLLEGIEDVSRIVVDRRDELETVIDRASVLVDAAASKDAELVRIIDDFGAVLERLVARRADITRLLSETAASSTLTADLVEERRDQIDRVLASFTQDLQVLDQHQVDLAHTLAYLGVSMTGYAEIGYSHGRARTDNQWANQFVTGIGSIGAGALLGCGGAMDVLLTDVFGPDPRCDRTGNPTIGDGPPREDAPRGAGPEAPPPEPDPILDQVTRHFGTSDSIGSFLRPPGGGS